MEKTIVKLKDVIDKGTSNLSANKLNDNEGKYPVYGANGLFKHIDFFQQEREYLAVIKDGAGVGRVYHCPSKSSILGTMQYLFPKNNINIRFAYYYLKTLDLKKYACGAAIPHIYYKDYCNETLALPSLDEQQKIVDILDKADEIRTKKRLANDKLDEFLKSTFIDMFGDPVKNPKSFEVNKLEEHIKVIGGFAFKSNLFKEDGIPVLRIGNINTGKLKTDNIVYWKDDVSLSKYKLYPNDLVISLTGTVGKDDYGNVCILPPTYPCYYLNQRNAKLVVNKETINIYYLCHLLKNKDVKSRLTNISRGVRQANISNSDILNLEIILPPINIQNKFAEIVEKVELQKQKNEQVIEQTDNLFNSLSQKAFKGEI